MSKFEGNVEAFRYTTVDALDTNAIVTVGGLVGVTRDSCPAGGTIMAFLTGTKSVYSLPLATSPAVAAIDRGSALTIDSAGKIKAAAAGDAVIGYAWEGVAIGDTEALVILADFAVQTSSAVATTSTAGLMSAADKTKLDGIGLATASKAGLVQPDGSTIDVADGVISVHAG